MKQWRCTVCGYIHSGDRPPEVCPVCGAGPELFELINTAQEGTTAGVSVTDPARRVALQQVLFTLPCGIFIVSAIVAGKPNGMVNNTLFQITDEPLQILLGIDKRHLTTEYILQSRSFSVCFIAPDQLHLIKRFGFQSGRENDKFSGVAWHSGQTGVPLLTEAPGYLECQVHAAPPLDAGTHWVFLAQVMAAEYKPEVEILTYQAYRSRKAELWKK